MADQKISQLTAATTPLAGTEVLPIVQSSTTKKVAVSDLTAGRTVSALGVNISNTGDSGVLEIAGGGGGNAQITFKSSGQSAAPYFMYMAASRDFVIQNYTQPKITIEQATGNLKLEAGNFVPATAAKGVDFSANTPAAGKTSTLLNWYEEGTWTVQVSSTSGAITTVGATVGRYQRVGRNVTLMASITITNNGTGAGALRIDSTFPFAASADLSLYSGSGINTSTGVGLALGFQGGAIYIRTAAAAYPVATGEAVSITLTYQV